MPQYDRYKTRDLAEPMGRLLMRHGDTFLSVLDVIEDSSNFGPGRTINATEKILALLEMMDVPTLCSLLYAMEQRLSTPVKSSPETLVIFDDRIHVLQMPLRVENSLEEQGTKYVGQLVQKREEDLIRYHRNFGHKSLKDVKIALAANGLHLETDVGGWLPPSDP